MARSSSAVQPDTSRLWLVQLLVTIVVVATPLWLWSGAHRIVPITAGCRTVRHADPRMACWAGQIRHEIHANGLAATLRAHHLGHGYIPASDCHQAFHAFGRSEAHAHRDLPAAALRSTDLCTSGYQHGFIEQELRDSPSRGAATALRICDRATTNAAMAQCFHGIGHGLGYRGERRGVAACGVAGSASHQQQCISGVVMQSTLGTSSGKLVEQCARQEPPLAFHCATNIPTRWSEERSLGTEAAAHRCELLAATERDGCVTSVAFMATTETAPDACAAAGRDAWVCWYAFVQRRLGSDRDVRACKAALATAVEVCDAALGAGIAGGQAPSAPVALATDGCVRRGGDSTWCDIGTHACMEAWMARVPGEPECTRYTVDIHALVKKLTRPADT